MNKERYTHGHECGGYTHTNDSTVERDTKTSRLVNDTARYISNDEYKIPVKR